MGQSSRSLKRNQVENSNTDSTAYINCCEAALDERHDNATVAVALESQVLNFRRAVKKQAKALVIAYR